MAPDHGLGDMMDDYWNLKDRYNYMRLNEKIIEPKGHGN